MFSIIVKDFDDGYFKLNHHLFFTAGYDMVRGGVTAHSFHNQITFKNANCGLNLHDINYTINKWRMLVKLYLDPQELGTMCARLLHYKSQRKHRNYVPDIGMQFKNRRNVSGACLMSITIGYNEKQGWHCEIFSRASETTMRWYADLILMHVLLREIGSVVGFTTDEMTVYWHMSSLYQSITSMPYFVVKDGQEQWLIDGMEKFLQGKTDDMTHWELSTIKRYKKSFIDQEYSSFRVQRRPMEAYKILKGEMEGKGDVWTRDLTLGEIDINQQLEFSQDEENDCFAAGGYR